MHWDDRAIVLSIRNHGENAGIAHVFSEMHGLSGGAVQGIHSKARRGIWQTGNVVNVSWRARLSEQLGSLTADIDQPIAAYVMQDADRLLALTSACALVEISFAEHDPHPALFAGTLKFLDALIINREWQEAYTHFEVSLLSEAGFRLDLSRCAVTRQTDDLLYVSPRSGRAVSREAGEPYKDKLLPLPRFLVPSARANAPATREEILAGLRLTGYFLENWLLEAHGRKTPPARQRLLHALMKEKSNNHG